MAIARILGDRDKTNKKDVQQKGDGNGQGELPFPGLEPALDLLDVVLKGMGLTLIDFKESGEILAHPVTPATYYSIIICFFYIDGLNSLRFKTKQG